MTKKITAIGNAIIDAIFQANEETLRTRNLQKGSMSLISDEIAKQLISLKYETIASGGSAANTIDAVAQLGAQTNFIGKVGNDNFGRKFSENLEINNTKFIHNGHSNNHSAMSFIFVTPDGQRTMCTYLGCASEIAENDIDENIIKASAILYLEGYLWYTKNTLPAMEKAIKIAKENNVKIALNLSDFNCVAFNKKEFLELIKNDLDIVIANEAEIEELLNVENIEENNFAKLREFFDKKIIAVVTRSQKGCVIINDKKITEISTAKIQNPVDTTGAGDAFAAGFFFGLLNDFTLEKSGKTGNLLAGKIIQKYGARFTQDEIQSIKSQL